MAGARRPHPGASRQRKHSGGSFTSERQRRFMWAVYPRAARKWAHNRETTKSDWVGRFRAKSSQRRHP